VTPKVEIVPVAASERDVLWRHLQFYIYDMTQFTGAQAEDGVFAYRHFSAYLQNGADRGAFWAKVGSEIAGFALVKLDGDCREMAEFFILRRWRRRGVGHAFARQLMGRSPGPWKLRELANNTAAIAFWRGVLEGFAPYTEAPLTHTDGLGRIEQRFVVS
jgi:predicted acetyltransferase